MTFASKQAARAASSAIGVLAILNAADLKGVPAFEIEEHLVVAATEPKAGSRRLELFHITCTAEEVAIDAVENGIAVARSIARSSILASGDQMTAMRSGGASPLTASA